MPSANRSHSKTPIGPFQNTVFAARMVAAKRSRGLGPDVEAEPSVRHGVVRRHQALRVRLERRRGDDVGGQLGLVGERIVVPQLLGHLPADEYHVRTAAQLLEDAELVLHLGAARDEHERPLDVAEQPSEHLELLARGAARRTPAGGRATPSVEA